jgi:hypothetical protein
LLLLRALALVRINIGLGRCEGEAKDKWGATQQRCQSFQAYYHDLPS